MTTDTVICLHSRHSTVALGQDLDLGVLSRLELRALQLYKASGLTGLFTGQCNTEDYGTFSGDKHRLVSYQS